ncbi:hypothetical protein [Ligilactobacillus aviarius]|uniref:hypothetical protein n=1 Tax=Ligilactobacillus aviarius TaxID=1606 RepID=UPI0024B9CF34|nr:hypothetical protein [Ligilactobacillus aviarius]
MTKPSIIRLITKNTIPTQKGKITKSIPAADAKMEIATKTLGTAIKNLIYPAGHPIPLESFQNPLTAVGFVTNSFIKFSNK